MTTQRIAFSHWRPEDEMLAQSLWGDPKVTKYICASGVFTEMDIQNRLQTEIACQEESGVQYWPMFHHASKDLIGCCGLRPNGEQCFEMGYHIRPVYWRQGYATEAARAVIDYAFGTLGAAQLFAGHHPDNAASRAVLLKLGFCCTGKVLYPPTGLMHPSYQLVPAENS